MRNEKGAALVVALMVMLLMAALGAALVLTSSTDTLIADGFRTAEEGLAAADAAAGRARHDLSTVADWSALLGGAALSTFVDGDPTGTRTLADGTLIDLAKIVSLANCQKSTPCSTAEMDEATPDRPWGANNPRWRLFAYGSLNELFPTSQFVSPFYVVVMLGDDPAENDADPLQDGQGPDNPGSGLLLLRAEAFGPQGAHRAVELTLARTVRIAAWRELR